MFWLPLLASAASTAYGEYDRQKRQRALDRIKFPEFNYGARREAIAQDAATQREAGVRAAQGAMAARGLNDSGMAYSAGRESAMNADALATQRLAQLEGQKIANDQQRLSFEQQREQQRTSPLESIAGGVDMFSSLYQLANPNLFVPNYGETAVPSSPVPDPTPTFPLEVTNRPKLPDFRVRPNTGVPAQVPAKFIQPEGWVNKYNPSSEFSGMRIPKWNWRY